jgi:hypothetical protein
VTRPHPALIELAAGRPLPSLAEDEVDRLLASAAEHRMTGLLFTRAEAGELNLPRRHLLALVRADLRQQAHHRRLWSALERLQRRFDALGVMTATFKGVSAETRWYDRLGERPCADLDLLLDPRMSHRIDEVVRDLQPGYLLAGDLHRLMPSGLLPSIDLDVDGIEVDLHTDLLKVEIPVRQATVIWDRTVTVEGPDGIRVRSLDPEISLVHLLLHLNRDRFARLLGYADVARLLAREEIDWAFVEDFLRGEGLLAPAHGALDAVADALGLERPPLPVSRGPRAALWRALWPEEERLQGRVGLAVEGHRQFWIPWLASGRQGEALWWWVRRRLLPPRALIRLYYPDTAGPYPWRRFRGRLLAARRDREHARRAVAADRVRVGALEDERYKTFPPRWSHIRVPTSSRGAAVSALMLYAPCRTGGRLLRTAAWYAVRAGGPRMLPGRTESWTPPVERAEWDELTARWRFELGPFETLAAYAPPQAARTGGAFLLIRDGRPLAFVKLYRAPRRPAEGGRALALLEQRPPEAFWAPRVVATGESSTSSWVALSTFPLHPHRPARRPPLAQVVRDVERGLAGLPRPAEIPSHWRPMHGDLTPWNLRVLGRRRLVLLDWDDAAWGPPGADATYFTAVAAALWGHRPSPAPPEAAAYWREQLRGRVHESKDEQLLHDVDRALEDMGRRGSASEPS